MDRGEGLILYLDIYHLATHHHKKKTKKKKKEVKKNMKISELEANQGFDELTLTIIEKNEPREVTRRFGGSAQVCDLIGEDETGDTIQVTLWNDEIDAVENNQKIKITDGWVKEWDNTLQVSTGRNGRITHI